MQGLCRGDRAAHLGDTAEMEGRCRGDAGEMQALCRGDRAAHRLSDAAPVLVAHTEAYEEDVLREQ